MSEERATPAALDAAAASTGSKLTGRRALGQILKARGVLREGQVQEALSEQRKHGGLIGQILVELGHCTSADVALALAEQAGLETVDLGKSRPSEEALALVDASSAHTFGVLPLSVEGSKLVVAIADPLNTAVLEDLSVTTGLEIRGMVADGEALKAAILAHYGEEGSLEDAIAAAFLHDALEDADRWRRDLQRDVLASRVGERVVQIVEAVSEPQRDAEGNPIKWRVRKEAYLASLTGGPPEAAAVALADKLHNAFSIASSIECGVDVFTSAPGRRALSAGPDAQLWFLNAAVAATEHHADARLGPMRELVREQITRLARAVASS